MKWDIAPGKLGGQHPPALSDNPQLTENTMFKIVEKQNPLAVHAVCSTLASAERWIAVNAVEYCAKGFFMDKSLTPNSFTIVSR